MGADEAGDGGGLGAKPRGLGSSRVPPVSWRIKGVQGGDRHSSRFHQASRCLSKKMGGWRQLGGGGGWREGNRDRALGLGGSQDVGT